MKGAWGTYWQLAQRETFMTPLITLAILISIIADRRKVWSLYFLVGVLVGLAATFKVTAVLILGILLLYLVSTELLGHEAGGFRLYLLKTTSLIIGAIIVQLPFLYYFWMHDSLSKMYQAVFVHTSIYARLSRGHGSRKRCTMGFSNLQDCWTISEPDCSVRVCTPRSV